MRVNSTSLFCSLATNARNSTVVSLPLLGGMHEDNVGQIIKAEKLENGGVLAVAKRCQKRKDLVLVNLWLGPKKKKETD